MNSELNDSKSRDITEQMSAIGSIWADTLVVDAVTAADSFFALGGDSIMITIMVMRVEQAFGVIISPDMVFDHPTLEGFTRAVLDECQT